MRGAVCLLLVTAAACGDDRAPAPPRRGPTLPSLVATPAGPADLVVATVDGRPVYGSCVAAQVRPGVDRRAALDECVALELAAQEAERRGLHQAADVAEETTRVLAAALVDRAFTAKYRTVADLPAQLVEDVFKRNAGRLKRDEYRSTFYARVDELGPQGTPADRAAQEAAHDAARRLAGRDDLFPSDVEAAVKASLRPGQTMSVGTPEPTVSWGILLPYYRDPVFALTAIGQLTPPARGPYGWDLILYTDRLPALTQTRAQILDELFPRLRMRWFQMWTSELERALGVERYYDDRTIVTLLGEGTS
jgi:hypothetical protein